MGYALEASKNGVPSFHWFPSAGRRFLFFCDFRAGRPRKNLASTSGCLLILGHTNGKNGAALVPESGMGKASILTSVLVVCFACKTSPGPGNFEKFTGNEKGVKALERYIQDKSNPLEARLEAISALVQAGWVMDLRRILDGCPDLDVLLPKLADELVSRLPGLEGKPDLLAATRDAAFIVLGLLPAEQKRPFQKRLAEWVFSGLGPDHPAEAVKRAVESKVLVAQICELGPDGAEGATWLIRHGFAVERLAQCVLELKEPGINAKLLEAFKKLHSTPDILIPPTHIEAIGQIKSLDAVEYLLDIAQNDSQDGDVRAMAFNMAAESLEHPEKLGGAKDAIVARLRNMLTRADPDDRWAAARYLVYLQGPEALDEALQALKDDGIYPRAIEDPRKTLVDFCKGVILKNRPQEEALADVKRLLASRNKVHLALGIVCVKAMENAANIRLLEPLLQSKVSLEPVFGEKMTVSSLAQNAVDGLKLMAEYSAAEASGKLSQADAKRKRFIALVNLWDTGEALRKYVEENFGESPRGKKP